MTIDTTCVRGWHTGRDKRTGYKYCWLFDLLQNDRLQVHVKSIKKRFIFGEVYYIFEVEELPSREFFIIPIGEMSPQALQWLKHKRKDGNNSLIISRQDRMCYFL